MTGPSTRFQRVDGEIPRRIRRPLAIIAIAGYPLALGTWLLLGPKLEIFPGLGAIVGLAILAVTMFAMYQLYLFRSKMAQASDQMLDERQRQVRDRAYVDSYRWFVLITLLTLVAVSLIPTLLDVPITLTYDVANWFIVGAVLISIALPSAVVAWREPDLED
jgi:hypothetical protein